MPIGRLKSFWVRLTTDEKIVLLFLVVSAGYGFAMGFSDAILANYFKEAYDVDAAQRGFIEFPRELPGVLSILCIAALAPLGNLRSAFISLLLTSAGILTLGLVRPGFPVMLAFLFCFSLGMHMFIPLLDSIGMSLAKRGNTGRLLGRFKSMTMAFTMAAGIISFIGFRAGWFSFNLPVPVFLIAAVCLVAVALLVPVVRRMAPGGEIVAEEVPGQTHADADAAPRRNPLKNIVLRREYMRYYVISALFGGRKQIMFVYSPWVLIELLGFRADSMSLLAIIGALIGVFFVPVVGKLIDRFGTRKIMVIEAVAFISVYIAYGGVSRWANAGAQAQGGQAVAVAGIGLLLVFLLNIVDKMSAQFAMVRSLYMQSIAIKREDVTPSLTVGMAIDHIVAIAGSLVCGAIWRDWGPEYVFLVAGLFSLANLLVALGIKTKTTNH